MTRSLPCLLLVPLTLLGAAPPARPTPDQVKALARRDALGEECVKALKAGNMDDAARIAREVLDIERAVVGPWHREVEGTANVLGDIHQARAEWPRAAECLRIVVEARRRLDGEGHWKTGDARRQLMDALAHARRPPARREALARAMALTGQGLNLSGQGQQAQALPLLQKALALRGEVLGETHPDHAISLNNLALVYDRSGDYRSALPLYQRAAARLRERLGERHPLFGTCLHNMGVLFKDKGDHRAALPLFRQAVALRKQALGDRHPDHVASVSQLGVLLLEMADYKAALPALEEASARYKEVSGERHQDYANSLNNLGMLDQATGNHPRARERYEQALALLKEAVGERHADYANCLNNLGMLLQRMGDYQAALSRYSHALALRKAALGERHDSVAGSLNNIALLHFETGNHKAALPLLRQALALFKETRGERHPYYATGLDNLAQVHQRMGDHKSALPLFRQALALRKELLGERHPEYATTLNNLAQLHTEAGDHEAALPLFRQASALFREALGEKHPIYATGLSNLALLHQKTGDHKSALPLFRQALAVQKEALGERHFSYATTLNNIALLRFETGDHKAAVSLFREATASFKEALGERHPLHTTGLDNLALAHLHLGDARAAHPLSEQALAAAAALLGDAAAVQSDRQQLAAAATFRHLLDTRLSLPGARGDPPSYDHVLAWKGALLLRQQQRRLFLRIEANPEAREAAERLRSITRRLAALTLSPSATRERLQELEKEQEEAQADLSRLSADFRGQERPSAAAVVRALPEDTALVDFLFYTRHGLKGKDGKPAPQRQVLAYVLRRGKPIVRVKLGPGAAVEEAVAGWRAALLGQHPEERARAERVRALIWAPLREDLEGVRVVLVSPDGVLGGVPFAALPGRKAGTFLIEDVTLAAVPLPRTLPEMLRPAGRPAHAGPALLVAGDLRYEPDEKGPAARPGPLGMPRLEATKAEVVSVAAAFRRRFPGGAVTDLREGAATKPAVRNALQGVRYAHLATHGYFAPEGLVPAVDGAGRRRTGPEALGWHPLLLSGLALSDANRAAAPGEEDGILTALEVSEMDLTRLDLAVLSACETGLGKAAGGEGLLGLQRAFQGAGARSVVASLWKVDDEYTRKLMTRFYAAAWDPKKPVGRAEALRQAQLALLREWDRGGSPRRLAPYFWAAFVLSGDWRRAEP